MQEFLNYFPNKTYSPHLVKKIPKEVLNLTIESLKMPEDSSAMAVARTLLVGPGICKSCGKHTKLISFNQGFRDYCSTKCLNNSPEIKLKKEQVSLEKYGTKHPNQAVSVKDKIRDKLVGNIQDKKIHVSDLIKKQGFHIVKSGETFSDTWVLKCQCGEQFEKILPTWSRWNTGWKTICPKCANGSSHEEKSIGNWIESLGFEIIRRDRTVIAPLELDIYIPKLNLAIEYNGLYWHSDDRARHFKKFKMCSEQGVKLIQIFEHEWFEKEEQIKSRLKSALGLNEKIYARKTNIKEISSREAREFFRSNHLHAHARGGILHVALEYDNKIQQVVSIGKARFSKKFKYELLRSASLEGITIVGGLSKLIKYSLSKLDGNLITYADLCWGDGHSYALAGGEKGAFTPPGYFWWKKDKVVSRFYAMKKNLKNILENFDPILTEEENMRREGWRQLWNAGNAVYSWNQ